MRMFEFAIGVGCSFSLIVFLMFGSNQTGFEKGTLEMRHEAVRIGAAHYESDKNGIATFVWNTRNASDSK